MDELALNDLAANIQHLLAKAGLEVDVIYHPSREDQKYWIEVQLDNEEEAAKWAATPLSLGDKIEQTKKLVKEEKLNRKLDQTADRLDAMMHLINRTRITLQDLKRARPSIEQIKNTLDVIHSALLTALDGAVRDGWWAWPGHTDPIKPEVAPVGRQVLLTLRREPEGHATFFLDLPDVGPMAKALIKREHVEQETNEVLRGTIAREIEAFTEDIAESLVGKV